MKIKFCERVNGKALFSDKDYKKDDIIFTLKGEIKSKPNKYTIEIGENLHILDDFGIYMNHSCNPTTKINGKKVIAVIDIKKDDELNFNYNDSESKMASPFYTDNGVLIKGKSTD